MSEEAQPVPGQDPAVQEAVQVQAPVEVTQGQGPWSDSLTSTFEDEAIRTQVDAYLRENVQPYVTQLEQKGTPSQEAVAGEKLLRELQDDPSAVYLALTEEIYGADAADAVAGSLQALLAEPEPTVPVTETASTIDLSQLPPEVQQVVQSTQQQEAHNAYVAAVEEIKTGNPDLYFDAELFNPFVVAAEGDLDVALTGYKNAVERYGITAPVEAAAATEATAPAAPPVIGSDTAATTAPPVQKQYGSMDEALDDIISDMRSAAAPPTVGAV